MLLLEQGTDQARNSPTESVDIALAKRHIVTLHCVEPRISRGRRVHDVKSRRCSGARADLINPNNTRWNFKR